MEKEKKKHGGARQGAGRPRSDTIEVKIRLSIEHRAALKKLGGSAWIREQIQKAIDRT